MGLLVGLPLKIFYLLFAAVRLLWPAVLLAAVLWLARRLRTARFEPRTKAKREPEFRGPVYTVDYEDVPEDPK